MAEDTKNTTNNDTSSGAAEVDYKSELAKAQAENARLKSSLDKTSSEVAEYKRKERDRMTDEAKAQSDLEEERAQAKRDREELAMLKMTAKTSKLTSDEKQAAELAKLGAEGKISEVFDTIIALKAKWEAQAVENYKAEAMKNNPQANAQGNGGATKTREEIMAVKDAQERQRLIAQNPQLFTRK